MATQSDIEWTECTWNFVTGCTKISPGCKHCYAEAFSRRLRAMGQPKYAKGFELAIHEGILDLPLRWRKPRLIFVNSMSDLFHQGVPFETIQRSFAVMREAHWHQFQILTKRSERLAELGRKLDWPPNVWVGVSVENAEFLQRADHLRRMGAAVRFLSLEPLLGPLPGLSLNGIDWVIVGGESGRSARPMKAEWVKDIRNRCISASIPFFFKQWGGFNKKKAGRILDGRAWDQMPEVAQRTRLSRERLAV